MTEDNRPKLVEKEPESTWQIVKGTFFNFRDRKALLSFALLVGIAVMNLIAGIKALVDSDVSVSRFMYGITCITLGFTFIMLYAFNRIIGVYEGLLNKSQANLRSMFKVNSTLIDAIEQRGGIVTFEKPEKN